MDLQKLALQQWIDKQKEKKSRLVTFSEALFSRSILSYVIYRLRYFSLYVILTMCMHVLEFYLLTIVFTHARLDKLILVRALISILSGGWWGMLEVMRTRVRVLHGFTQKNELARELASWHLLGFILCGVCFIVSISFCFFAVNQIGLQNSLSAFYIAVIVFQLGLHIVVEVRRAGIFARFRVARTVFSMLVTPIIGVIMLASLWWFVGGYTLPLSIFFTSILSTAISLHFIQRAYTYHQWPTLIWPTIKEIRQFLPAIIKPELFLAGVANMLINIEGMLIWILYYFSINHSNYSSYYMLFYFISPLLNASSTWARLFYFDIKKYQNPPLDRLIQNFNTRVLHLTLLIGLFYGLIATLFSVSYFQENAYSFSLLLIIFFILRSSVAYLQIIAFSKRYYLDVILSGFIVLLSVLGFIYISSLVEQVLILFGVLIFSYLYIYIPRFFQLKNSVKDYRLPSYIDWLVTLSTSKSPTTVLQFKLSEEVAYAHKIALIKAMEKYVSYNHCLWVNNHYLLIFIASNDVSLKEMLTQIAIKSVGLIENYRTTPIAANGLQALHQALEEKLLFSPAALQKLKGSKLILPKDNQSIIALFKQQFPFGNYYEFRNNKLLVYSSQKIQETSNYYHLLLKKVCQCLMLPTEINDGLFISVSGYCDLENNTIIFVIPLSYENCKSAAEWKLSVFRSSVQQFFPDAYPLKE